MLEEPAAPATPAALSASAGTVAGTVRRLAPMDKFKLCRWPRWYHDFPGARTKADGTQCNGFVTPPPSDTDDDPTPQEAENTTPHQPDPDDLERRAHRIRNRHFLRWLFAEPEG